MKIKGYTRTSVLLTLLSVILSTSVLADHGSTAEFVIFMSFIAFIAKLGLAIWVYLKNPFAKVNKYFCIVFLGQAVWDFGKFMLWQIPDAAKAMIWAKISYSGYVVSVFVFLYFAWAYLKRKNFFRTTPGHLLVLGTMFTLLVLLWTTDMVIAELIARPHFIDPANPVWAYSYGSAYNLFFLWFQMIPFLYGFFVFGKKLFTTSLKDKKGQLFFVMLGSAFPIIIGIPTGVILPALGILLPPHNNILTLIMTCFIAVGIIRYKFLAVQPIGEKARPKPLDKELLKQFKMDYSNFYFISHNKSVEMGYKVLLNYLTKKHYGLVVTAKQPDKIRLEHGIKTTPIVWITDSETEHLSVDPVDIEQLNETIRLFCKKVKKPFIFLDGLDYLIHHNNFGKILRLVQDIKKVVEKMGGVLIIPEGNLDLTPNELRLLHKELTLLPYSVKSLKMQDRVLALKKFKSYKHLILGFTEVTESLLEELEKERIKPTIITTKKIHHHIPPGKIKVIKGDPLSKRILLKAGVGKPNTLVMITMDDDSSAILAINKVRQISANSVVVTNIDNREFVPIAVKAGADHVVPSSSVGGRLISLTLCAPNAVRWIMDATTLSNKQIELVDIDVSSKDWFNGKTVRKADLVLGKAANIIALKNEHVFHKIPDDDHVLKAGDHIVLIANLDMLKVKRPDKIRKKLLRWKR